MEIADDKNIQTLLESPLLKELPDNLRRDIVHFAQGYFTMLGETEPRPITNRGELLIAFGIVCGAVQHYHLPNATEGSLNVMFIRPILKSIMDGFDRLRVTEADTEEFEAYTEA